jgi:hypothetical protein
LAGTNSESKDDDPRAGEKVTSKETQMSIERICKYCEQRSVSKDIIQHILALYVAIGKINEKRKSKQKLVCNAPEKMRL